MRAVFSKIKNKIKSPESAQVMLAFGSSLLIALFIWSLLSLKMISTSYSFSQYMPKRHELLKLQTRANSEFQGENINPFLLVLKGPQDWLSPKSMSEVRRLSEKLAVLKGVRRVTSLATAEGAVESEGQIMVGPIFESLPPSKWSSYADSHDLVAGQLISRDHKSNLILIEPERTTTRRLSQLSTKISLLAKQTMPGTEISLGGAPEVQLRFTELLKSDLSLFVTLSFLVFSMIFFSLFRGWSALGLTVVNLLFCNVLSLAMLSRMQIPVDILLSTMPIVTSVAVLSIMIHSCHRWAEVVAGPKNWFDRFWLSLRTLHEMFRGNMLGSMTTSLGFLALVATAVPAIQQYGAVIAGSILVSWLCTQMILLLGLHLTRPSLRSWSRGEARWTQFITRHHRAFIAGGVTLALAGLTFSSRLHFGSRIYDDLSINEPARQITEFVDAEFGGNVAYDLTLTSSQVDFWKKSTHLKELKALSQDWKKYPEVGSILGITSLLPASTLRSDGEIAEQLFMFSMSSEDPVNTFLTDDGKALRLRFRFHDVDSNQIKESFTQVKRDLGQKFSNLRIEESGIGLVTHTINREVSKDLVFGFWQSMMLIALLLVLVFRSWRYALVACLPNLLPPLVLMGFMALHHTSIKPGIAILFSITLGVAFNNTVYILSRLKEKLGEVHLLRENEDHFSAALRKTLLQEGNPCLFETLMMMGGFSLFLLSRFQMNQMFGGYMILAILSGAFGDLVVLPAILKLWGPRLLGLSKDKPSSRTPENLGSLQKEEQPELKWSAAAALILAVLMLALLAPQKTFAADEVHSLLGRVRKNIATHDDNSEVEMTIIEANGSKKVRKLKLETLQDAKFHAIAQVMTPVDVKGTAVLSEVDKNHESQWLYTPSSHQVRRLMNVKSGNGVLGSEITMDDLNSTAIKSVRSKIVHRDAKSFVVELIPRSGSSVYDRVEITIDAKLEIPLQTEYFKASRRIKSVEFRDYRKFTSVYRAQDILVHNSVNHRGTELHLVAFHPNSGLTAANFSPSRLKDN